MTFEDKDLLVFETASISASELQNKVEDIMKADGTVHMAITHISIDQLNDITTEDDYYDNSNNIWKRQINHYKRN